MTQPKIEDVGHGKPVMPFGSDGTDWYAFLIDVLGHLQVDVVSAALGSGAATETTLLLIKGYVDTLETLLAGGLPAALDSGALKVKEQSPLTGFATSANQATMITALQLIDDLRAALGSVNTDDLQVDVKTYPGSNALGNFPFGLESVLNGLDSTIFAGGSATALSAAVPTGKVWVITTLAVRPLTRAATSFIGGVAKDGVKIYTLYDSDGVGQYYISTFPTTLYLDAGDKLFFDVGGGQDGDEVHISYSGYQMAVA